MNGNRGKDALTEKQLKVIPSPSGLAFHRRGMQEGQGQQGHGLRLAKGGGFRGGAKEAEGSSSQGSSRNPQG